MNVELSAGEIMCASLAGAMRGARARWKNRRDAHGFNGDGWGIAIEGAAAELAVAKAIDAHYDAFDPLLDRDRGDVAGLHVRSTQHLSGHLTIYRDDPNGTYVLVIGRIPCFRVAGWIEKEDAIATERWWRSDIRDPAFWVPQEALAPIQALTLRRAA